MKHALILAGAFMGAFLLSSCVNDVNPALDEPQRAWTSPEVKGLVLSIENHAHQAGQTNQIDLSIRIENRGEAPVRIFVPGLVLMLIRDTSDGSESPLPRPIETRTETGTDADFVLLKPNEFVGRRFALNRIARGNWKPTLVYQAKGERVNMLSLAPNVLLTVEHNQ